MITKNCKFCGEEFDSYKSQQKLFCSKKCYDKWKSENIVGEKHPNWSGGKIKKQCKNCNKEFKSRPSENRKFCSKECTYNYIKNEGLLEGENNPNFKEKITKMCKNCGEEFKVQPSGEDRKFCSKDCHYKYRDFSGKNSPAWKGGKVELECEYCGEKYYKRPSRIEDSRFCSQECLKNWMSENLRGKDHPLFIENKQKYYGKNWKRQRKKVLKRDNYTCQICDSKQDLQVHHKKPIRTFKEKNIETKANKLDNLITLCVSCHMKIENNTIENLEAKYR